MTEERSKTDQFGKDGDAVKDGGASDDRGGRDAGSPGPDPGGATAGGKRYPDATQNDSAGTGSTGGKPSHRSGD